MPDTHELKPAMQRFTFRPTLADGALQEISLISNHVMPQTDLKFKTMLVPRSCLREGAHTVSGRCLPAEARNQVDRRKSFQDLPRNLVCTFNISSFCCDAVPCTGRSLVRQSIG